MNKYLTSNKKSQVLHFGIILLTILTSTSLMQAAFQARAAAHTLRHGTRSLVPAVQRQFSTQSVPTEMFSHEAKNQRHWIRPVLLPATVAAIIMIQNRNTAHCAILPHVY